MGREITTESYKQILAEKHPTITLCDGVEYEKARVRIRHHCSVHGEDFYIAPYRITCPSMARTPRCESCKKENMSAKIRAKSDHWLGKTNKAGHTCLEIEHREIHRGNGVHAPLAHMRYRCGVCGDESNWMSSPHFISADKKSCGCYHSIGGAENFKVFLTNNEWGMRPCMLYISPVWFDTYTKIGITDNYGRRAEGKARAGSNDEPVPYDGAYFVSHLMPRAHIWVIEQILLEETKQYSVCPKTLPEEMANWSGKTELRKFDLDPEWIENRFFELLYELQDSGYNFPLIYKRHLQ